MDGWVPSVWWVFAHSPFITRRSWQASMEFHQMDGLVGAGEVVLACFMDYLSPSTKAG
jgi:hypothetical protein